MIPINWYYGLAIKDDNDPFIVALREGRIEPGEVETIVLGGDTYVVTEVPLPDGLWAKDGTLMFECRSCGQDSEWYGEPEDFEFGHFTNVCGGSPRCLP
jgi:hypothetical protein